MRIIHTHKLSSQRFAFIRQNLVFIESEEVLKLVLCFTHMQLVLLLTDLLEVLDRIFWGAKLG